MIIKVEDAYRDFCKKDQILIPELEKVFQEIGLSSVKRIFPQHKAPVQTKSKSGALADLSLIYRLRFDKANTIEKVLTLLAPIEALEYAEPSYIHELFYQPNDPFADSTGIGPGNRRQWGLLQIKAFEAWDIQRGDSSILIGVVDSGHRGEHPDMQDNLGLNLDDPIDGLDNDQDGFVDNYAGWDFGGDRFDGEGDNDPNVGNVHGFFVAGILGATTDNGIGMAGSSFNCSYLPIKAAPDDSIGAVFYGYEGIVYAVDQGAQIVNCSWGGPVRSRFGADVVQYATANKSAALIVAAGNSRSDAKFYPAAYPQCISVANTHFEDVIFSNSTYNYSVDIAAPGGTILSTFNDTYANFGGTSAAAPMAAGALGIVMAQFDNLTGFQAAQRMRITADDISAVNDSSIYRDRLGKGRINLFRALTDTLMPAIRQDNFYVFDADGDDRFQEGDTLTLVVDFVNYLHAGSQLEIDISLPPEMQPYAQIISSSLSRGNVNMWDRFSSQNEFQIRLNSAIPINIPFKIRLGYEDVGLGYEDFEYLEFFVNEGWIDIEENLLQTSVNSQGNFGFNSLGQLNAGLGVQYGLEENALFEGGFLIGKDANSVSDRLRNNLASADNDFGIAELIQELPESGFADFHARTRFDDLGAISPVGIRIAQHSFAFEDTAHEDYVIFQYILENATNAPVQDLYAGLFADWDIFAANRNQNEALFDSSLQMVYARDAQGINGTHYGMALLTDQDFHAFATVLPSSVINFSNASKYVALSNVPDEATATAGSQNGGDDIAQFISGGPMVLAAGNSDTISFALLAGESLADLEKNAGAARLNHSCRILDQGPNRDFLFAEVSRPTEILFGDQNPGADSWFWNFGDGSTASEQNPLHLYDSAASYQVRLEVMKGPCKRVYEQTVEVKEAVSVDPEFIVPRISIYPNPAQNFLAVSLEGESLLSARISLFALNGQLIEEKSLQGIGQLETRIEVSELGAGIFFLQIQGSDFNVWRKVKVE
ncbi:MAG: S8 family serine peptidase [Bacteroidota bacterium]